MDDAALTRALDALVSSANPPAATPPAFSSAKTPLARSG
jgi:hypothetical protein